jgi:hypothetical protein
VEVSRQKRGYQIIDRLGMQADWKTDYIPDCSDCELLLLVETSKDDEE